MHEQNVRLHTKDGIRKKVSVVTLSGLKQRLDAVVTQAFGEYAAQVRGGAFPAERHCYAADASGWHTDSDPLADIAVPVGAPTRPLLHTT